MEDSNSYLWGQTKLTRERFEEKAVSTLRPFGDKALVIMDIYGFLATELCRAYGSNWKVIATSPNTSTEDCQVLGAAIFANELTNSRLHKHLWMDIETTYDFFFLINKHENRDNIWLCSIKLTSLPIEPDGSGIHVLAW